MTSDDYAVVGLAAYELATDNSFAGTGGSLIADGASAVCEVFVSLLRRSVWYGQSFGRDIAAIKLAE